MTEDEITPAESNKCALCAAPSVREIERRALCPACADKVVGYQDRLQSRLTRLQNAAAKETEKYKSDHERARQMAQALPLGQPVLVGHHSEGRDRNYRKRIHSTFSRAFAHLEKAEQLSRRAEVAESNAAIRSDDPLAIAKLEEKIAEASALQERMKTANVVAGKSHQSRPYASYELTNNNANIKRMEVRLKGLQSKHAEASADTFVTEETHGDIRLTRDAEGNRLRLHFPGKPTTETMAILKRNGFIWSGRNGAWQRQLNTNGERAAQKVLRSITHLYGRGS